MLKINHVTLYHISMPYVHPFETSFGVERHRHCIVVQVEGDGGVGWGE